MDLPLSYLLVGTSVLFYITIFVLIVDMVKIMKRR
jgi:hypothetical protein